MPSTDETAASSGSWWTRAGTLTQVALSLVILAAAWYLLKELAALLRPLLLAILLCHIILPIHSRIHQGHSRLGAIMIMTMGALAIGAAIVVVGYGSILEFNDQLPYLAKRADEMAREFQRWSDGNLPGWAKRSVDDVIRAESHGAKYSHKAADAILNYAANMLVEAVVVALYVIFIIVEARRFPKRIGKSFDKERAEQILDTIGVINQRIGSYLKTKTKASAILAVPVVLVLFAFNVKFAIIWGVLTFLCNFIPYIGSFIGCGSPLIFAFLDLPPGWKPFAVAGLLISIHVTSAVFIEPIWIGNAVRLSPLVILIAMTFWGLCWGMVGVLVAVPLTVTLKIILANIDPTKPIAAILGD
jgi:AI-2 transport protein TqsA